MMRWQWALAASFAISFAFTASCGPTQVRCYASNCSGCCEPDGSCSPGDELAACGKDGASCKVCVSDGKCTEGVCSALANSDGGTKDGGTDAGRTGGGSATGGGTAVGGGASTGGGTVSGGGSASGGGGGCGPCPGCCDSSNQCRSGTTNTSCGTAGAMCISCPGGQSCLGGACLTTVQTCDAVNCSAGCCDGTTCVNPPNAAQCGKGGAACTVCAGSQVCTNGTCVTPVVCNAATCPTGCCEGTTCVTPTAQKCGTRGAACGSCPGGVHAICSNGACAIEAFCDITNCPDGCCEGTTCWPGNTKAHCGDNGGSCDQCLLLCALRTCTP